MDVLDPETRARVGALIETVSAGASPPTNSILSGSKMTQAFDFFKGRVFAPVSSYQGSAPPALATAASAPP
jgi:hypothetical protein